NGRRIPNENRQLPGDVYGCLDARVPIGWVIPRRIRGGERGPEFKHLRIVVDLPRRMNRRTVSTLSLPMTPVPYPVYFPGEIQASCITEHPTPLRVRQSDNVRQGQRQEHQKGEERLVGL